MNTRKETFDRLPRSTWEQLIDEWIYNELDRHILRRHIFDGITFDRLTEEINRQEHRLELLQVKRRFYKATDKLLNKVELDIN